METGVAGFRVEGSWYNVVEHGRRISEALRGFGIPQMNGERDPSYAACYEEWEAWRPKLDDELDVELKERTAEQASVNEGPGEQADVGVREDIRDAGRRLNQAVRRFTEKGLNEAMDAVGDSVRHASRAADTASRRALRAVEDSVYEHIMTHISPYYFDNELISAHIEQLDEERYVLEVNVNDDGIKEHVGEVLEATDLDPDPD